MATVRQTVQDLVNGEITLQQAVAALRSREQWDTTPEITDAQLFAVEDIPPAGDNHPDQIDLVGFNLSARQREALWRAVAASHG